MNRFFKNSLKTLIIFVGLLILTGCSGYKMQQLKDQKSSYFYKKDYHSSSYYIRYNSPKIYADKNKIDIFLYKEYKDIKGFEIDLENKEVSSIFTDKNWLRDYYKIPSKYYKFKRTYNKNSKWATYWILIYDPKYPKIFLRWKPDRTYQVKAYNFDIGRLEVMILPKDAGNEAKEKFQRLVSMFDESKTILSEEEKAQKRAQQESIKAMNAYFGALMGQISSQYKNAINDAFSHDKKGIKIEDSGFKNGKHNYSLYKDGEYDGIIYYYKKDDGFIIDTLGVKKGQSVNGFYTPSINQLYTPQCGYAKNIYSIDEAIKKAVNCIYKKRY